MNLFGRGPFFFGLFAGEPAADQQFRTLYVSFFFTNDIMFYIIPYVAFVPPLITSLRFSIANPGVA